MAALPQQSLAVRSGYRCGRCAACQPGGSDPCPTGGGFGQTGLEKAPGLWGGYSEYLYLPAGSVVFPVDGEDPVERVLAATDGAGVDCVVDTTPYAVNAVNPAVQMIRQGGTIVLAALKGRRAFEGLSPDDIIWKKVTLRGVLGVEDSAFHRAVDTIHSRKYPMERLHTTASRSRRRTAPWPR